MTRSPNPLALLALLCPLAAPAARAAGEFKSHNFLLPGGSVKVDEDRFRLPQTWEDALRFYRQVLPPAKYPRHPLRSQSGIRALHIANPRPSRSEDDWEGVNLYEFSPGEVRLFVLAHPPATEPPAPPRKPSRRGG